MIRHWMSIAMVLSLPAVILAGEKTTENPFRRAKFGDYANYKYTIKQKSNGKLLGELTIKTSVSSTSEKEVMLTTTASLFGKEIETKYTRIELTRPFDPLDFVNSPTSDSKFVKTGAGNDKIIVANKAYDCTLIKCKVITGPAGKKTEGEATYWLSKAVPLTGIARIVMTIGQADHVMELTDTGHK